MLPGWQEATQWQTLLSRDEQTADAWRMTRESPGPTLERTSLGPVWSSTSSFSCVLGGLLAEGGPAAGSAWCATSQLLRWRRRTGAWTGRWGLRRERSRTPTGRWPTAATGSSPRRSGSGRSGGRPRCGKSRRRPPGRPSGARPASALAQHSPECCSPGLIAGWPEQAAAPAAAQNLLRGPACMPQPSLRSPCANR